MPVEPWPETLRGPLRRPAALRPRRHRRDRGARPHRPVGALPARVGSGPQPARSATPTTASPSTGTCSRPRPTPPRSPTGSSGPTCWWSARCCTTSARAGPATTPRSAWSWSPRSAPAWASTPPTPRCSSTCAATTCCCPTSPPAATSPTRPPSPRSPTRSATRSGCTCSPRSPRPTRWPPGRRRGARGRPSWSASWSAGSTTTSRAATQSSLSTIEFPERPAGRASWPRARRVVEASGAHGHRHHAPTGPACSAGWPGVLALARPRGPVRRRGAGRRHGARAASR